MYLLHVSRVFRPRCTATRVESEVLQPPKRVNNKKKPKTAKKIAKQVCGPAGCRGVWRAVYGTQV